MKTIYIFFILFSPIIVFGQTPAKYSIVVQGEKWIADNQPDSTLALAQNLLSQTNLDPFKRRQAFYLLGEVNSALGKSEEAIDLLQESIVLSQKNHDDPLLVWSLIAASRAMGDKENPSLDSVMFYLEGAKVLEVAIP
ncbi:MAG: hypothetical protein H7246_06295 [Phycisphaerae bacterium]|nr:hypothetical protein [Saprospiraceae bacterium]